jgi:hypothetical protein
VAKNYDQQGPEPAGRNFWPLTMCAFGWALLNVTVAARRLLTGRALEPAGNNFWPRQDIWPGVAECPVVAKTSRPGRALGDLLVIIFGHDRAFGWA